MHARSLADAAPGLGVTHHSAPNSDYWEGDWSLSALAETGAAYGEFLAAQIHTPRPAWLRGSRDDAADGHVGELWLTPRHFPLEGSTTDSTLDYFDRLRREFRDCLAAGGLAIIGSHPDLDRDILVSLFRREGLENVSAVTVMEAVERCRRVRGEGAILMAAGAGPGEIALVAREPVADLARSVWLPDEGERRRLVTQLVARAPRRIEVDAPSNVWLATKLCQ